MSGKKILLIAVCVAALGIGSVAGGVALLLRGIKSCGAYTQALAYARRDPRVQAELGAPVEADWYVMGSVNLVNDGGEADLTIPLMGSKRVKKTPRTGKLHVVADKAAGAWTLKAVDLTVMDGPETPRTLELVP